MAVGGVLLIASAAGTLDGAPTEYNRFGEALFFTLGFWLMLLALVRRVWIFLLIASPAALLAPMEIWFRTEFGMPTSVQSIALVQETSWSEAVNFFVAYGGTLAGMLLVWLLVYGAAIWSAYRYRMIWRHRSSVYWLIIFPAVMLYFYMESDMPPWIQEVKSSDAFDGKVSEGWSQKWSDIFPINILTALQQYELEKKKVQKTQSALQRQSLNGRLIAPQDAPEVVILVVGESATATHWSVLGYPRKTTPRLDAQTSLVAFADVVGLSVSTRTAVPGVLSRRPVLRADGSVDPHAEPSLIKAFSEAGYQTHWFSNQSPFGEFDTSIAVHAREAQDVRFLNPSTFSHKGSLDGVLLNPLHPVLKMPGRHLIVLHMLGSHFDYSMRYPHEFDVFTPSMKNVALTTLNKNEEKERIGNSYDNSILYTDYLLSKIIEAVNVHGTSALVAYFSDHGSDLPNDKCPYKGSARTGEAAFRVPVFFWFSQAMQNKKALAWEQLRINQALPYTTRAMFSTLLELTGIRVSGEMPEENFLRSPDARNNVRQVAVGTRMVDFDKARLRNSCVISVN